MSNTETIDETVERVLLEGQTVHLWHEYHKSVFDGMRDALPQRKRETLESIFNLLDWHQQSNADLLITINKLIKENQNLKKQLFK